MLRSIFLRLGTASINKTDPSPLPSLQSSEIKESRGSLRLNMYSETCL